MQISRLKYKRVDTEKAQRPRLPHHDGDEDDASEVQDVDLGGPEKPPIEETK